ncbi:argininosuccinate lyase [candidate division WOR-3 bacterium]|nr:argininosuccinate lyase [candidate division WOR-3 bacterium]
MGKGKIWKGRFSKETDVEMEKFSHSIETDKLLFSEDLAVNKAWAQGLNKIGILSNKETKEILNALGVIKEEFSSDNFAIQSGDEDIHSAIERRLTEITGVIGEKIHTGRSRNDQVMTDLLLYLKKALLEILEQIAELEKTVVDKAKDNFDLIMPGYTHLQQAQPILFSHYLLSLFWLIERDKESLLLGLKHCGIMPLGSAALAGTGFPVDLKTLARDLGFNELSNNSLDITAHRDIPTSISFTLTTIISHLSRYASDLILWSTDEFGFVEIDDKYATGSSIMPQKKNPDSLELIRGKAASAIGHLTALLSLCQGLPHSYNRDLQEDKKHIFEIVGITKGSLEIFSGVLKTLKVNKERITRALSSALLATEMADYLTEKGVPFRTAHTTTGNIVKWAKNNNTALNEVPLSKLKDFSSLFEEEIYDYLNFKNALSRRNSTGGTGEKSVKEQINKASKIIRNPKSKL